MLNIIKIIFNYYYDFLSKINFNTFFKILKFFKETHSTQIFCPFSSIGQIQFLFNFFNAQLL